MTSLHYFIVGLLLAGAIAQEGLEGSGGNEELATSFGVPSLLNADTEEGDDFVFSSGDMTDSDNKIQEGSGGDETKSTEPTDETWKTIPMPDGVKCDIDGSCFCTDTSGNKVLATRVFKQYPECKPARITDITKIIPSRPKPADHEKIEVTAIETTLEVEVLTTKKQTADSDIYLIKESTSPSMITDKKFQHHLDNKIPTNPPLDKHNEQLEEETNVIADHQTQNDVKVNKEPVVDEFTHPGILAALIGTGLVVLLCLVLLVMFIVYRMKKKDEGSYPLDSSKQSPMYAKVPDKEFFA